MAPSGINGIVEGQARLVIWSTLHMQALPCGGLRYCSTWASQPDGELIYGPEFISWGAPSFIRLGPDRYTSLQVYQISTKIQGAQHAAPEPHLFVIRKQPSNPPRPLEAELLQSLTPKFPRPYGFEALAGSCSHPLIPYD